jgi:hypothetical protein
VASLGGSSQSAGTAAAPAPNASNATLDDRTKGGAGNATGAASDRTVQQAGASPAPTPAPQAFGPAAPSPTAAATPSDTSKFMVTPSEQTRQDTAASSPAAELHTTSTSQRPQVGLSPWAWLVLAIGFGVLAFVLGRRLRAP